MEKDKNVTKKIISVPIDVLMDILKIILEAEVLNTFTDINENKNTVEISLDVPEGIGYYQKVLENIDGILSDYQYYRFEEEEGDWRDS